MEIALSQLLGRDDIITPARADLESQREQGVGGQNYRLDHPDVPGRSLWRRLTGRPERYYHSTVGYYEHMPGWRVRRYVGEEIWNSYYKFTFERNPWDRQVSFYFYKTRGKDNPRSFDQFLKRKSKAYVGNYDIYAIDGEIAVNFVGSYENLNHDFNKAMEEIGIKEKITLPVANVSKQKDTHGYRQYYTDETRNLIAGWYAAEIDAFGYKF
ncbi:sulfotransferase family protein [bacterium BMS3Bbin10]|nr:sulfotransferase family protein [bacterium BMS3Bbin10]